MKTYKELNDLQTFEDRFEYLKNNKKVGYENFGYDRYMNQNFYRSKEWKQIRDYVITRDNGCDLGIKDRPIMGKILIHHIEPLTKDDIKSSTEKLLDPNNLICVSNETHQAIHYNNGEMLPPSKPTERKKNDTKLW